MESLAKLQQPLHLSLNPHRLSFPKPISSFRISSSSPPPFNSLSIKASSSSSHNHKPSLLAYIASPILKTTCVAVVAAALFFVRFHYKPAFAAAPIAAPSAVEESSEEAANDDQEKLIEEQLSRNPDDMEALRSLMEVRIKANKLQEAVQVLDRLIELEPDDNEWPVLKANIHSYMGELELAKYEFEEILKKDPLRVEAYHGLVMAASQSEDSNLEAMAKRVEEAMKMCEKQRNKSEVRDFKLLIAQIRVMESNYSDALKLYQELAKDEPRDFRPYLCQGIIYTLLKKKNEAEKQFDKFRRLIPKEHPYREYFDDNMFATKLFSQKVERETAGSRS
ncbi:protein SLOW GREEN 1, chloroplastic-like [Humulus lupulus]|uniref:protein SLOW GREEN 1, chloroplastic-like n=1 Tax=Humulus lupulus TaxID=3486 RepID=UPI002B409809|nr:protein SLOW GREEN 1, chloroplastic-like [Humulus lupulus]XP_062117120.1 protein SLOW GREEN 1, chloroplastic-like [Humulus lupulus]